MTGLDLAESLLAVELAAASYLDDPRPEGWSVTPVWEGDTQAFVVIDGEHLVVAFRGTEADDAGDWWTDLKIRRTRVAGLPGSLHRGFVAGIDLVADALLKEIRDRAQGRRVLVVGHSLGGGLAMTFLAMLAGLGWASLVDGVITFGAPRVASRRAARWLHKEVGDKLTRWQAWGDRVPLVPPLSLGYLHFGGLVQLGPAGEILTTGLRWVSQVHAFFTRRGAALGNHSVSDIYRPRLSQLAERTANSAGAAA